MGGRGSSSSAGGIGAVGNLKNFSTATQQFNPASVVAPSISDIQKGNILPTGGVSYDSFKQMSDDDKADVIAKALMVKPPMFLDDSAMQRFAYFTGMSDKPQVVSDSVLDKMKGKSLYRTVYDSVDKMKTITYTSTDIYKQITTGDFTQYSDKGGSAFGNAIYFAQGYSGSASYGWRGSNAKTMRAKLSSNAKTITTSQLNSLVSQERAGNTKLYQATRNAGQSANNLLALAKGYNVVVDNNYSNYHMVLNRGALVMSDELHSASNSTWK